MFKVYCKLGAGFESSSYCLDAGPTGHEWEFKTDSEELARAFRRRMEQAFPGVVYEVHEVDDSGNLLRVLP